MSDLQLSSLIEEGRALLRHERALFSAGALGEIADLAAQKRAFVDRFEQATLGAGRVPSLRQAVSDLIEEAKRNESLLAAAREGVTAARRKLKSLAETRRGAVAYDRDGTLITSREDAIRKTQRA